MAELGQTSEPKALVPGEVSAVVATMHAFRDYAENLEEAGQGLLRITTEAGWRGEAADAFNNLYQGQPSRWLTASGCFESAADALDRYADTLSWAQAGHQPRSPSMPRHAATDRAVGATTNVSAAKSCNGRNPAPRTVHRSGRKCSPGGAGPTRPGTRTTLAAGDVKRTVAAPAIRSRRSRPFSTDRRES